MWNKWDLLMYSLILLAIGIRSFEGDEAMRRSKLFSGVAALLVWMRATRFFAFSKTLGPKLHMVHEMIGDVAVFCALLILILIGYGVSYVIIQMPWRSFDDHVMADIVYRPTFMVFGETFLDGTRRSPFNSTPMGVNSIPPGSPRVRPMGVHRTCGEPDEIKKNTHPKYFTALCLIRPAQRV